MRLRLRAHRVGNQWQGIGAIAVAGLASLAAFVAALLLIGPFVALAVCGAASMIGFAVAVRFGGAGGDDPRRDPSDDDPPWWPSFEDDLRRYEKQRVRS
jgi:hypothetical protein